MTFAEDAPLSMFTNGSEETLFCRSSIVGLVDRVIVGETWSITSDDVFPFKTVTWFTISAERVNS